MPRAAAGAPIRSRRLAAVALLVCACALASTATALAAASIPNESTVIFEGQLNRHQVSKVTLFTKAHTLRITLDDGRVVKAAFPPVEQQRLLDDATARGIAVKVAKGNPSHKRRYIAGGVVIVLAVASLLMYIRRRRIKEE